MKDILVSLALLLWEIVITLLFFAWYFVGSLIRFVMVLCVVPIWILAFSAAWGFYWFFDSNIMPLKFMLRHRSVFETRPAKLWEFIVYG